MNCRQCLHLPICFVFPTTWIRNLDPPISSFPGLLPESLSSAWVELAQPRLMSPVEASSRCMRMLSFTFLSSIIKGYLYCFQVFPVYGTPLPCHHLFVFSHSDSTTINIQLSSSTAYCIIDDFQRTRFLTCKNLSCPLYVTCGVSYATCTHLLEYFTLVASRTLLGVPPSWRCAELQVALTQHVSLECSVEFRHDRVHSVYGGREPQSCRELLPGYPSSGGGGPFLLSP